MTRTNRIRWICEFLLVSLIFFPLLIFLLKWTSIEKLIEKKILEKVRLAPGTDGNESWINSPVTTRRAYRLFNVTNSMDIMTNTSQAKLDFRETKPFHYRLLIKKNNVEWLDNNTKIRYSVERFFTRDGTFDEKLLSQEGAFVDILRVMFRTKFTRVADDIFYVLGGNNAFNYSHAIDKLEGFISPIFAAISSRMQGPNREKYGFIFRYNGSNGYNFTIETGSENASIKGQMIDFHSEYTPFEARRENWQTDVFDALTFPPLGGDPPNRRVINVFQGDFCRPVQLRYNQTVAKFGFPRLHQYVLKLVDVDECPSMDEHCPELDKLDITKCFSAEIPSGTLYLTKPHLFGHNSSWTNVNFRPSANRHESTIYFEPISGTPIRAQLRIQLNTNAYIDRIRLTEDGSTEPTKSRAILRFIPMMWIDQTITLNDEVIQRLQRAAKILHRGEKLHRSIRFAYLIVGLFLLGGLIIVIELYLNRRRVERTSKKSESKKTDA